MSAEVSNLKVLKKIWEFRKKIEEKSFPKTGRNTFQNYDYYTESDVFGVVNPLLAEFGLLPDYRISTVNVDTFDKGYRYRISGTMVLIDMESGETLEFGPILADGADNTDKAAYKANTGFVRTIWCKFLGLSNKDEPENEAPVRASKAAPASKTAAPSKEWNKDSLFSAASRSGKLADAQKLKAAGKSWDEIASELKL